MPARGHFGSKNEPPASQQLRYAGRISLVFEDPPANSPSAFSGAFELRGTPLAGELDLLTPLGAIAAQMKWQNSQAQLIQAGQTRSFTSVDEMILQATGASISAQQLFNWLRGNVGQEQSQDWQVDLSRHADGRIMARRNAGSGQSAASLRIILDQP